MHRCTKPPALCDRAPVRHNYSVANGRNRNRRAANRHLPPWWFWVGLAAMLWLLGKMLIGIAPTPRTAPTAIAISSVFKGFGYFLSYAAPGICLFMAAVSAISAAGRPNRSDTQPIEPCLTTGDLPNSGETERDLYTTWKAASEYSELRNPGVDTTSWSLPLLKALEWKRLEQLCAVYFRTLKFRVEEATPGPDGGIDLRLFVGTAPQANILVQCKAWRNWVVGVKDIRELFGVMASECVGEGIFVTTSTFSQEAVAFARGKNIALIDGEDLLAKLRSLSAEDQVHILRLATEGDFMTPSCPSCGVKLLKRSPRNGGEAFWGCPRFPRCRFTLRIAQESAA
jgi:hypothetical protein